MPKKKVKLDKTEPVEMVIEEPAVKVETDTIKEEIVTIEASESKPETPQPTEEQTKGPAQFIITSPTGNFTREDAEVPLTVATLVKSLGKDESIIIKRVK